MNVLVIIGIVALAIPVILAIAAGIVGGNSGEEEEITS